MKVTMNIDEALLDRVVKHFNAKNRTHAVDLALREIDRKANLKTVLEKGLGLSPEELTGAFDEDYDLNAMRVAEGSDLYRGKRRSG